MKSRKFEVGSIWKGKDGSWSVQVTKVSKYHISAVFIDPNHYMPGCWTHKDFLYYYEPVYTVEGFEV